MTVKALAQGRPHLRAVCAANEGDIAGRDGVRIPREETVTCFHRQMRAQQQVSVRTGLTVTRQQRSSPFCSVIEPSTRRSSAGPALCFD